jgi:ATP-dependent Zn protease
MVTKYGMSNSVGLVFHDTQKNMAPSTRAKIDEEVSNIVTIYYNILLYILYDAVVVHLRYTTIFYSIYYMTQL